jgi:hypothetical protein
VHGFKDGPDLKHSEDIKTSSIIAIEPLLWDDEEQKLRELIQLREDTDPRLLGLQGHPTQLISIVGSQLVDDYWSNTSMTSFISVNTKKQVNRQLWQTW